MDPPWDETEPQWRALDAQIEEGDLVRIICQSVDGGLFDVEAVFDQYSGRGSKPHPPDLLLKLALYEHCRGRTKPIQWHRDLTNDLNVRWLTFGMKVAQKTLYNFRDRLAPLLAGWHKQVLEVAVAEQLVDGRQASIDGTAVAANASRRKLGNMQQVDERLKQLQQAMTPLPETADITLYAPWQENGSTAKKKKPCAEPRIEKDEFRWDDIRQVYVCPQGKDLSYSHKKTRQRANGETIRFDVYQASPSDCTACPLRSRCTAVPQKGRSVRRDAYQAEIDRLQTRMQTAEAKSLYKQRGQTIERVFADFKEHRNLRRFRGRGLSRARTQLGLTVLGHNLRIVAKLQQKNKHEANKTITLKNAA